MLRFPRNSGVETFVGRKKIIAWSPVTAIAALSIAGSCYTRFAFERRLAREVEVARASVPAGVPQ